MSEDKHTEESGQPARGPKPSSDLRDALEEAVQAAEQPESDQVAKVTPDGAVAEAMIQAKHELEDVLEQTRKEAESFREKWLRAAADLENYRKRAAREREDVQRFGNEKLLRDFLPIVDDLERGIEAALTVEEAKQAKDQMVDGVRLVLKKFLSQLERHGVSSFDAEGEVFDPSLHEAVQQIPAEVESGRVVSQLQRGFKLNDRLLRPAVVVVSLGPTTNTDSSEAS